MEKFPDDRGFDNRLTAKHSLDRRSFFIYNPSICGSGLIVIANLFIKITFLIAGLFSLWKFIEAGFVFINSEGDPQKVAQARDKIMMTFVGLLVMVASFALAGIVGALFFGSASAIINPSLTGVGTC